jgi:hypothetical protein
MGFAAVSYRKTSWGRKLQHPQIELIVWTVLIIRRGIEISGLLTWHARD